MNYFFFRTFNITFKDILRKLKNKSNNKILFFSSYISIFSLGTYNNYNLKNYKYYDKYREDILKYE